MVPTLCDNSGSILCVDTQGLKEDGSLTRVGRRGGGELIWDNRNDLGTRTGPGPGVADTRRRGGGGGRISDTSERFQVTTKQNNKTWTLKRSYVNSTQVIVLKIVAAWGISDG